jgi:hypothetical protein
MNATALTALIVAVTALLGAIPAVIIAVKGNSTAARIERNTPVAIASAVRTHEDIMHGGKP